MVRWKGKERELEMSLAICYYEECFYEREYALDSTKRDLC